jgi:hypothetical protein
MAPSHGQFKVGRTEMRLGGCLVPIQNNNFIFPPAFQFYQPCGLLKLCCLDKSIQNICDCNMMTLQTSNTQIGHLKSKCMNISEICHRFESSFRSVLIGVVENAPFLNELSSNDIFCSLQVDLSEKPSFWKALKPPAKDKCGELLTSLCYHPSNSILTLTLLKARNLKAKDINGKSGQFGGDSQRRLY